MLKYTIAISFILIASLSYGQKDKKIRDVFEEDSAHLDSYQGLELGFNITNVLSRFVGNSPGTDTQDFPFLFRYHFKKTALRLGLGAQFNRSSFFDNTTQINRQTEDRKGVVSLGFERNFNIKKRLSFYYGIDVYGAIEYESVNTSNNSASVLAKNILRFGGGPFVGFSYSINQRVRLHTETNVSGFYQLTETTEIIGGQTNPIADTDQFGGEINPPIALYINLKF